MYNYLNAQAKDETTYASSPIWGIMERAVAAGSFARTGT